MPFVASEKPVPFRFSFALQGAYGRVNPNGVGFNSSAFLQLNQQGERTQGIGAVDLLVQWGRFGFFGEFYGRHISPARRADGGLHAIRRVGAGALHVLSAHSRFRRALRLGRSEHDAGERSVHRAGEAQLAWFIVGTTLALRLRYGVAHQQDPGRHAGRRSTEFLTTVGLPIAPGTVHLVTLPRGPARAVSESLPSCARPTPCGAARTRPSWRPPVG